MIKKTIDYTWLKIYNLDKELKLKRVKNHVWEVIGGFSIHIDRTNESIVIPNNFKTDLASIPRLAYTLFPRSDEYDLAATVHDYLYSIGKYPRKTCDNVFKDLLILSKVKKKIANLMYMAVRTFGKRHYNGDK